MKPVQIMFDPDLLAELDRTAEVRERGRSAVLRQLAGEFVRRQRRQAIDARYEEAYSGSEKPLGEEFEGWQDVEERRWPS